MSQQVVSILVRWILVSIIISSLLGALLWYLKSDVPSFLATIPASGFALLGAMWQVERADLPPSPVKQDSEVEEAD